MLQRERARFIPLVNKEGGRIAFLFLLLFPPFSLWICLLLEHIAFERAITDADWYVVCLCRNRLFRLR